MLQTINSALPYALLLVACACAAATDIRSRKIPNAISFTLLACAFAYQAFHGPWALLHAFAAVLIVIAVGLVGFSVGIIGGGDVKLLAAGCACLPPSEALYFLLFTGFGGGILALATAAYKNTLRQTISGSIAVLHGLKVDPTTRVATQTQTQLPYAIAITFGALSVTLMHTFDATGLRVF